MTNTPCFVRRPAVLALSGFSESALDREIRRGIFPPAIKLSPDPSCRAVGWVASEIAAVNTAKIAGVTEEELRRLVADLVKARAAASAKVAA